MYGNKNVNSESHCHTLGILVNDEPGVLTRISGMFMKRNFNIKTITVGASNLKGISKITVSFYGNDEVYEQLVKQLNKLIDVIKTTDLSGSTSVVRELALIKISVKNVQEQNQIMNYCRIHKARVVNVTQEDMIIEIVGKSDKIDTFYKLASTFGIKDISRTGVTAISRK